MCYKNVMPCPRTPFPREALSASLGTLVRDARETRQWSRAHLARKVGVNRRTIVRLEDGVTKPGVHLVRALMRAEVLGNSLPSIKGWSLNEPYELPRGLLSKAARLASGQTLAQVAVGAGSSTASLSSFERGLLAPRALVGEDDDGWDASNDYARVLGFVDGAAMREYLKADDPRPWLVAIAKKHGRELPPSACLPVRRPSNPD